MSFMKQHQARIAREQAKNSDYEPNQPYTPATAMATPANAQKRYKVQLAAIEEDLKRLSAMNSVDAKRKLKQDELIEKYKGYVAEYIESSLDHQDDVVAYMLIWLFDTRQIEKGINLYKAVLERGLKLPERFNRDLQTYVLDEVYDFAEPLITDGKSASPYFDEMFDIAADEANDIHEAVKSKYYKLAGIWAEHQNENEKALMLLEKAQELDPKKAQVKTKIKNLKKRLDTE